MRNIIQFMVTKEQGVYTADGVNLPVVTEGSTFEELQVNIQGSNPATINVGSAYIDLGAIVHDNQGHDL